MGAKVRGGLNPLRGPSAAHRRWLELTVHILTMRTVRSILESALIHAQPLKTPPQPESVARQRGADSRIVSSILCVTAARCWGEHRGVPKGD
jgi:hypothetical protein